MKVIESVGQMLQWSMEQNRQGVTVAFVPTMGYLHEGHLELMRVAKKKGDKVVVSIFVNPTQFGPNEDFERYPRDFDRDITLTESVDADLIFYPEVRDMYPAGFLTTVIVQDLENRLCGASRPGHFRGVCTIVLKLFEIVRPKFAVFGWKDAQQLLILKRMVQDLNIPIEMMGVDTFREPDGLAMSSRNKYLTPEERSQAPTLFRSLCHARDLFIKQGEKSTEKILNEMRKIISSGNLGRLDYCEIVSMDTLQPIREVVPGNTLIVLAFYFSKARLIDNIRL